MASSYSEYGEKESGSLWQIAQALRSASLRKSRLSPFVFMTDPARMDRPIQIAKALPAGSAIIYRHFGANDRMETARALRQVTKQRQQQFLIGADPELAHQIGADGVHMPRNISAGRIKQVRHDHPDWLITQAAPKDEPPTDSPDLDALFISSIFSSQSPSAGEPIGVEALQKLAAALKTPVYALGGITGDTAPKLIGSGASGIAAIQGILSELTKT